ncbi:DHH family phosphoesterase [Granulicatella elegans]|uniref:DHH family phosphoesterase n=1 Tax=Granulicatella elegans TaxID=137732 RepID=UPI001D14FD53|nr:DHH family phosphoesterase [Granulicatella elegans]UEA31890.1 DHH family phosphoesterase [Granulicatella elegans]
MSFVTHVWLGFVFLFWICLFATLVYFSIQHINKKINEYAIDIAYKILKGEQDAYLKMPIGMILYDKNENITWINPYLQKKLQRQDVIGIPLKELNERLYYQVKRQIQNQKENDIFTHVDKKYQVIVHSDIRMIYLTDITEYASVEEKYHEEQIVFGQIFLDNFSEVSQSLNDRRKSNLNNFVTNQLSSWAIHHNIFMKRVDDDRFIAFLNRKSLEILEKEKFDIMDKIRETTAKQNYPLTVSMGFSYPDKENSDVTYPEIASYAQANLDLALGRGGDQVVVRSQNEDARFYGGKSNPMEKRTRVRARMVSQALKDLMEEASEIIVMGHQFPDMDAIGACLGIRRIANMNQKKAWIVTNENQYSHDIHKLMDVIQKQKALREDIITPEEALEKLTPNTLVILVDVSRPVIAASPEVLKQANKIVVIDHHRRSQDFPKNPVLVYIEPYASSTGELITELFEYQNNYAESIQPIEATAMLGGIIVDTRNFTLRTGSRTFDAASYLKSVGADTILIQRLLKENVETFLLRSHLLNSLILLDNNIGIVQGEEDNPYSTVVAAQTADMMLSMENIDASFVVTKREDGRIGISGRSLENKNVQRVMEKMGGGGHLSNAATQLSDTTIEEAVIQLKEVISDLGNDIDL